MRIIAVTPETITIVDLPQLPDLNVIPDGTQLVYTAYQTAESDSRSMWIVDSAEDVQDIMRETALKNGKWGICDKEAIQKLTASENETADILEEEFFNVDTPTTNSQVCANIKYYVTALTACLLEAGLSTTSVLTLSIWLTAFLNKYLAKNIEANDPRVLGVIMPIWTLILLCNYRLQLYNLGNRSDGKPDISVAQMHANLIPKPTTRWHKAGLVLGTLSQFSNGFFVAAATLASDPVSWEALGLGAVVGLLKWISYFMADLPAAYRKKLEAAGCGTPLVDQFPLLYKSKVGKLLAHLIINVQPVYMGYVHFNATMKIIFQIHGIDASTLSGFEKFMFFVTRPWYGILLASVYMAGVTYTAKFDMEQLCANMEFAGIPMENRPWLLKKLDDDFSEVHCCKRSLAFVATALSQIVYGEALLKLIDHVKCVSPKIRAKLYKYYVASGQGLGLAALIIVALQDYVLGPDDKPLSLMQAYAGLAAAKKAYGSIKYAEIALAFVGGLIQAAVKNPMVMQAHATHRVRVENRALRTGLKRFGICPCPCLGSASVVSTRPLLENDREQRIGINA